MSKSPIGSSSSREDEPSFWIYRNEIEWLSGRPSFTFTVSVVLEDAVSVDSRKMRLIIAYDPRLYRDYHVDLDIEQFNPDYIRKYDRQLLALRPGRARSNKLYQNSFKQKPQQTIACDSGINKPPLVVRLLIGPGPPYGICTLEPIFPTDNSEKNWRAIFDCTRDTAHPNHAFHLSFTFAIRNGAPPYEANSSWRYIRIVPFPQDRISVAPDLPPRVIRLIMHFLMNIIDGLSAVRKDILPTFLQYGLVRRSWRLPALEVFFQRLGRKEDLRIPNAVAFSRYLSAHPQLGEMVNIFNTMQFRIPATNRRIPPAEADDVSPKELLPFEYKMAISSILTLCPDVEAVKTSSPYLALLSTILPNLKRLERMAINCPFQGYSTTEAKPLLNMLNSCRKLKHLKMHMLSLNLDNSQSSDMDTQGLSIPLESLKISYSGLDGPLLRALLPQPPYGLKALELYMTDCRELTNTDLETILRLQSHSLETVKLFRARFITVLEGVHPVEAVLPEMTALKLLECDDVDGERFTAGIVSRKLRTVGTKTGVCKALLRCDRATVLSSADISFSDALEITGWDSIRISGSFWTEISDRRDELFGRILQANKVAKRRGIDLVFEFPITLS